MDKKWEKILRQYEEHCQKIAQSTTIDVNETSRDKVNRIKDLEQDYISWFEYYFPMYAKKPSAPFHREFASLILNHSIIDLLLEIYRSGGKSVHIDMGIPLFLYVRKELKFMLLVGQTADKAKVLISDIQAQLQYNQRFVNDYGKRYKYGDWADGDFSTIDGCKFVSFGIRQSVRGVRQGAERPDYIVVDDVDDKQRCNSDKRSREAYEWVWEDLKGTFDEGGARKRFIVANNNFHPNTIINQLKKEFEIINQKAKEKQEPIRHFCITVPAVKDLETFEPTWPAKTSAEYWRKKFDETPYRSFMREYMHKHVQDGTIFKDEQIQWKQRLPWELYDAIVFYGDLSYKEAGDYKAMITVGKTGREFHVLAAFVRRTSRRNAAIWLYEFVQENKLLDLTNVRYYIEGLFAQDEFVNDFDLEGDDRGWYVPVVADDRPKANKFDRIESMSGYFERGNVWFNEEYKKSVDFNTLIEGQLKPFEKGSTANDDAPDAMQGAIAKLNKITFVEKFEPRTVNRQQMIDRQQNRF